MLVLFVKLVINVKETLALPHCVAPSTPFLSFFFHNLASLSHGYSWCAFVDPNIFKGVHEVIDIGTKEFFFFAAVSHTFYTLNGV